jgi:hypothetical protein
MQPKPDNQTSILGDLAAVAGVELPSTMSVGDVTARPAPEPVVEPEPVPEPEVEEADIELVPPVVTPKPVPEVVPPAAGNAVDAWDIAIG